MIILPHSLSAEASPMPSKQYSSQYKCPPPGLNVTNYATAAIVVVLSAVGGTTSPAPGTYALENATSLQLTATPDSGWIFDHWVIGGYPLTHGAYSFTDTPTDNPYNVNHGYGNTYTYQPVFSPTSTTYTNTYST